jgi:hypothetical protein
MCSYLCNTLGDKANCVLHFTCHIILHYEAYHSSLEQLRQSHLFVKSATGESSSVQWRLLRGGRLIIMTGTE